MIQAETTNYALRLMGPRRFSGKASIECIARISERVEYAVEGDAFSSEAMEARYKTVEVPSAEYKVGEEREIKEELLKLEDAILDEVEVLLVSVEPKGISAVLSDGVCEIAGEIKLSVLLKVGEEAPYTVERTLDYKDTVALDGVDGAACYAHLNIPTKRVETIPLEDGVSLSLLLRVAPEVYTSYKTPLRLIVDCYSTEREVENTVGEFVYPEDIVNSVENDRYSYNIELGAVGLENVRNILYSSATPKIENIEMGDSCVRISGIMRFSGIACEVNEEGEVGYSPVKIDAPFEKNIAVGEALPDTASPIASITVTDAKIMVDGANLALMADLGWHTSVRCEGRVSCITSSALCDTVYEKDPSHILVYYPTSSDTLFEIAKRHHTSVMRLASDNALTEGACRKMGSSEGLSGIKYLVIK